MNDGREPNYGLWLIGAMVGVTFLALFALHVWIDSL